MIISRRPDWWDEHFLGLAKYVSTASKDPSTQVGAVIVDNKRRIVSVGFNGLPRGVSDTDERLNDRELKYKMVVHAEVNAIIFAHRDLTDCVLYTWPFLTCSNCASIVVQTGIVRCVAPATNNPRWKENINLAVSILAEANIVVDLFDCENISAN